MSEVTRDDKIKCLRRELAFRRNVYRKRVAEHRMHQWQADRELAIMEAVLADYEDEPT